MVIDRIVIDLSALYQRSLSHALNTFLYDQHIKCVILSAILLYFIKPASSIFTYFIPLKTVLLCVK